MADKKISVRITTEGGDKMRAQLVDIGREGKKSFNDLEKSSNSSKFALQNASYQIQDIFVQVAGGTSASRALSQQLPQLLSAFGLLGVLAGTAAAALIPLGSALFDTTDYMKAATDAVKTLDQALSALKSADKAASMPKLDLEKQFGPYAEKAKEILAIQRQIADLSATRAFGNAAKSLTGALGGSSFLSQQSEQQLRDYAQTLKDAKAELVLLQQEESKLGEITTQAQADEYEAWQQRNIANQLAFQQTAQYRNALADLATQFGVTEEQASQLAIAAKAVSDAGSTKERLTAAQDLAKAIFEQSNGLRNASEETVGLYNSLVDAVIKGNELAALDITSGIGLAADNADRLAKIDISGNIAGATAEAWQLAAALGISLSHAIALSGIDQRPKSKFSFSGVGQVPELPGAKYTPKLSFGSVQPYGPQTMVDYRPDASTARGGSGRGGGGGGAQSDDLRQAQRLYEQTRTEAEKYKKEQADINDLFARGKIDADLYQRSMEMIAKKYADASDAGKYFDGVTTDLKDAFLDLATTGEASFAKIAKSIERAIIQAAIFGDGPLGKMFGGGLSGLFGFGGGDLFANIGGKRAGGGSVVGGRSYLVGENGPELFAPNGSGIIHKSGSFGRSSGGSGGGTSIQIIDQRSGGQAIQTERKTGPDGREVIIMTVRDATGRGELDSSQRRFGAKPVGVKR